MSTTKLFILADGGSAHTIKWVSGLLEKGFNIYLFSLGEIAPTLKDLEQNYSFSCFSGAMLVQSKGSILKKANYLKLVPKLKKEIRAFKPDILHAHYATSYGLLAFLSGFKPYVASLWGSDIMVFPNRSFIHRLVLKQILCGAKMVFSSSKIMEGLAAKFLDEVKVQRIPFGIDLEQFKPEGGFDNNQGVRFCIVKTMAETYGVDIAIKAFVKLLENYPQQSLHIAGDGVKMQEYQQLAGKYLDKGIHFYGKIPYAQVPEFLNKNQVFVNLSRSESFGVSVIEAGACGLPSIISNRGGLPETVFDGETGTMLPELNEDEAFKAMEYYINNTDMIAVQGKNARAFVERNFDFQKNLEQQIRSYQKVLQKV